MGPRWVAHFAFKPPDPGQRQTKKTPARRVRRAVDLGFRFGEWLGEEGEAGLTHCRQGVFRPKFLFFELVQLQLFARRQAQAGI